MKKRSAAFIVLLMALVCLMLACFCACSDGSAGKSAYEIWLEEGHTGSQSDFLEWLKGDSAGSAGKSAYEIWLDNGFEGTEMDFLNWLKADGGNQGDVSSSDSWNIAASVSARLTQKGEKYKLTISGSGNMQSWASAESVPWYSVSDKIDEIVIGSEVTNIGDYAFSNVAVSSLLIPESVQSVGKYALPAESTVYTYEDTAVAPDQNDGAVISVYSADAPATHDRHWTSWGLRKILPPHPLRKSCNIGTMKMTKSLHGTK